MKDNPAPATKVRSCPAKIVLQNVWDRSERKVVGVYYGSGDIRIKLPDGTRLEIDPDRYHKKDPKRLILVDPSGNDTWAAWRVRSILLDSKHIVKNG